MPKGSPELAQARREEIVSACEQLYRSLSFKEITLKEIAGATSFTRPSIYNYFHTKEEIFLELLKKEYELWIAELRAIAEENQRLSREQLADKLAESLSRRQQLLKILSMNMYDIEENSRMENLVAFKAVYGQSMQAFEVLLAKFLPASTAAQRQTLLYQFFPFIYGIYPYAVVTDRQRSAMQAAGVPYAYPTVYQLTRQFLLRLLPGE